MGLKEFELTVEVFDRENVSARAASGESNIECKVELDDLKFSMIQIFDDWLRKGKIDKLKELQVLGEFLYQAIFNGEVKNFFENKLSEIYKLRRAKTPPPDERIRLELVFHPGAKDLAGLPWEFLYCPNAKNGVFLAKETWLVLSRYIPLTRPREDLTPPEGLLKILIVASQPEDIERRIEGTGTSPYDSIIKEIENLKVNYPVAIMKPLRNPTIDEFIEKLDQHKPHVVHYIGYGRCSEKPGVISLLEPGCKTAAWCTAKSFADLFGRAEPSPHLVFLHLCQGPQEEPVKADYLKANFAEVAPELIGAGIQAVVAMRYPIDPSIAETFTEIFYKCLTDGKSVATAVQEGRWGITKMGVTDYTLGSPVLYMQSRDGPIVPASIGKEDQEREISITHQPTLDTHTTATPAQQPGRGSKSFLFDELTEIAFEEGRRKGLRSFDVSKEIERLREKAEVKDMDGIRQVITEELQEDPNSPMIPVYLALLKELKSMLGK